jgi:hypothetical protein
VRRVCCYFLLLSVLLTLAACGEATRQSASTTAQKPDSSVAPTWRTSTRSSAMGTSSQQRKPILESGLWEGEYIDANGHRGELGLDLETSASTVTGTMELVVRTEDEPQVINGEIDGAVEGKSLRLHMVLEDRSEVIECVARVRSAGSYARQALTGTIPALPRYGLGGGVWIAWHFRRGYQR